MSAIRRFNWSRENIRHTGITLAFVGSPVPTYLIIVGLYVSYDSELNHFNLIILSAKGPKSRAYSSRGQILYTVCPFLSFLHRNRQAN